MRHCRSRMGPDAPWGSGPRTGPRVALFPGVCDAREIRPPTDPWGASGGQRFQIFWHIAGGETCLTDEVVEMG